MTRRVFGLISAFALLLATALFARDANAAGTYRLKSTEISEVSGAWHVFLSVDLPSAPATAHVPFKFSFVKNVEYERALTDNSPDPVLNKIPLQNQMPQVESLDVDFADGTGKVFKSTRFDFGLTRTRGFVAGEYTLKVRDSNGNDVGTPTNIILKGDNPVVDRRAITFNAKDKAIKKVDTGIDGGNVAKNSNDVEHAGVNTGDIAPAGSAEPFIPKDAYEKTPEEELKEHPKGCGCTTHPGDVPETMFFSLAGIVAIAMTLRRLRRS